SPFADLGGGVSAVALVGDNEVERVDRDIELGRVRLVLGLGGGTGEGVVPAEEVDAHALNRADVDEGMARVGVGEVLRRQDLRIERLALVEVLPLESLAIHLVDLIELEAWFGLEGRER